MSKRFLAGVATADMFRGSQLIGSAKTLLDSSITIGSSAEDVRGGEGMQLYGKYYHTSTFDVALTDVMFKLDYIALQTGSTIKNGADIFNEEQVILTTDGAGAIVGTPVQVNEYGLIGWATIAGKDTYQTVTFTDKAFTFSGGKAGDVVCIKYMVSSPATKSIVVSSAFVPDTVRLVLRANLYEGDSNNVSSATKAGVVTIDIPRFMFNGSQDISMSASGVANMPLNGSALANSSVDCNSSGYYAIINETINSANWYDNIFALAVDGGDITLSASGTKTLSVYAVPTDSTAFIAKPSLLTFTSSDATKATVSPTGLVTAVAAGTTTISIVVTGKVDVETVVNVTVKA